MFGGFGYACLASAYFTTAHIGNKATPWVVIAGCIEGLSAAMVTFYPHVFTSKNQPTDLYSSSGPLKAP